MVRRCTVRTVESFGCVFLTGQWAQARGRCVRTPGVRTCPMHLARRVFALYPCTRPFRATQRNSISVERVPTRAPTPPTPTAMATRQAALSSRSRTARSRSFAALWLARESTPRKRHRDHRSGDVRACVPTCTSGPDHPVVFSSLSFFPFPVLLPRALLPHGRAPRRNTRASNRA